MGFEGCVIHAARATEFVYGRSENLLLQSRKDPECWSWRRLWNGQVQASADGWSEEITRQMFEQAN